MRVGGCFDWQMKQTSATSTAYLLQQCYSSTHTAGWGLPLLAEGLRSETQTEELHADKRKRAAFILGLVSVQLCCIILHSVSADRRHENRTEKVDSV